eukprot:TRINITY_DN5089_c0_g1_i1.p1 TRINITY_DN5089_c0_g1~~TRINITY_DN5089_c0_g1_i1.p1  ORF type:complete len:1049 (+),score=205.66 TRINITY_DN5089_c0_g1_i1:285-3431(+)
MELKKEESNRIQKNGKKEKKKKEKENKRKKINDDSNDEKRKSIARDISTRLMLTIQRENSVSSQRRNSITNRNESESYLNNQIGRESTTTDRPIQNENSRAEKNHFSTIEPTTGSPVSILSVIHIQEGKMDQKSRVILASGSFQLSYSEVLEFIALSINRRSNDISKMNCLLNNSIENEEWLEFNEQSHEYLLSKGIFLLRVFWSTNRTSMRNSMELTSKSAVETQKSKTSRSRANSRPNIPSSFNPTSSNRSSSLFELNPPTFPLRVDPSHFKSISLGSIPPIPISSISQQNNKNDVNENSEEKKEDAKRESVEHQNKRRMTKVESLSGYKSSPILLESSEDESDASSFKQENSLDASVEEEFEKEMKAKRREQKRLINELDTPRTTTRVLHNQSPESKESDDESEEEFEETADLSSIQDEKTLKMILEKYKRNNEKTKIKTNKEKIRYGRARETMRSLISQITTYKSVLESEKESIASQLEDANLQLKKTLEEKKRQERMKGILVDEIAELKDELDDFKEQHSEILQEQKQRIDSLQKETIENLSVLMKDLQAFEEVNEQLTDLEEQLLSNIRQTRESHAQTLADLIASKELEDHHDNSSRSLSLINSSLVDQIKVCQSGNVPEVNQKAIFKAIEDAEKALSSLDKESSPRAMITPPSKIPSRHNSSADYDIQNEARRLLTSSSSSIIAFPFKEDHYIVARSLPFISSVKNPVRCLTIANEIAWVGFTDGTIHLYNIETLQLIEERKGHTSWVYDLKLVRDKYVWSISKDKTICVWSPHKSQPVRRITTGICTSLIEANDTVWASSIDGSLQIYDSKSGRLKKELKSEGLELVGCMLKRGNRVWVGADKNIHIWNCTTFKSTKTIIGHEKTINALCSVGPYEIWSCSSDKTVRCWNAESYQCIKLISFECRIYCMFEMRTNGNVWCGNWDSSLSAWSAKTYELVTEFKTKHKNAICTMAIDAHERIWTGGLDGSIFVWQKRTENSLKNNETSQSPVVSPREELKENNDNLVESSTTPISEEVTSNSPKERAFSLKRLASFWGNKAE